MKKLMKSLPIVAKILGDKYGVRVEVGGHRACTDGHTIYLPALPDDDRKAENLVRGYIDHEAAHVRFKTGLLSGPPLERALQNILEDIRIESRMKERYRGCGGNLNRMINELVADGSFEPIDDEAHPGAVVQAFLLHRLRCDVLGQKALSGMADQSEAKFHEVFSRGKAARIAALGYQAESAASIDEIKALVKRILTSLEEDEPDGSSNQSSDESSDDSQSDQDQGQSQTDDSDSDRSDGSEDGQSQDQNGESQEDAEDDQEQGANSGTESSADNCAESDDSSTGSGSAGQSSDENSSEESQPHKAAKQALSASDSDLQKDT